MATKEQVVAALKTLAKYADLVADAYLSSRGTILNDSETDNPIKALRKHRLVWVDDEEGIVQISSTVSRLLDNSLVHYRRHQANEVVAGIWETITNHLVPQYLSARKRNLFKEVDRFSQDIQEAGMELIQVLDQSTRRFSQYITNDFAYVRDLELRIRENERVIKEAGRLNDLIMSFQYEELNRFGGQDPFLRRLFNRQVPAAIQRCNREITDALHNLRGLLHKMRSDLVQARLIRSINAAFTNDPSFSPNIDSLFAVPDYLNRAKPLLMTSSVDVLDESQHRELIPLAQSLAQQSRIIVVEASPAAPLEDTAGLSDVEIELPYLVEAASELIASAMASDLPISARKAYDLLAMDEPGDLWLFALMNALLALPEADRQLLHIECAEVLDPQFSGNSIVCDLLLSKRAPHVVSL
ncbi:MAG: hypothetical protein ABJM39_02320 [Porticoccus sp.]|jgi:hypothetical protein|uniref:hypothetical protein n=1 Tax=Porticoccus sp. TaxID=2024853 RepID=UPI000C69AAB6|nr:hypothetical protein [Porticoccus sp.]MAZ71484.1 hypothetical protein [Porticoccus sp.]|tara:strand:+ start:6434 stop:7672 length:1239 start_codon:yes stop_codon:yes gene_type:complete